MNRRRFLAIAAAVPASRAWAGETQEWRAVALGAEVRIVLRGSTVERARRSFIKVARALRLVEEHFSLYRESALTRLNRMGRLSFPPPAMLRLFDLAGEVHAATSGLFDPTIQPLWLAVATSGDVEAARSLMGWKRIRFSAAEIALEPGMQLTFNGMAQGHAADEVAAVLREDGFADLLIDTGEIAALGKGQGGDPWRAAIATPDGTIVGRPSLSDRALATSSPMGTRIGAGAPHILHPLGRPPVWQLASVSAPCAALADALSTVSCLMQRAEVERTLHLFPGVRLEALI